jgi:hypothetical protein
MHDARDEAAARNNAKWCAAVWQSHGLPVEQECGFWICARETPQYYPNLITVDLGADPSLQETFIADFLRSHPSLPASVKDSFAALDLHTVGMTPLFDARWLVRPAGMKTTIDSALQWHRIDDRQLAAWEAAWRADGPGGARIFRPPLLADPSTIVLGGFDGQGAIKAGGIAYDAAGALGITNVFGSRRQFIQTLGSMRPESAMLCYAAGDQIQRALQDGFQALGPLRVWVRKSDASRG